MLIDTGANTHASRGAVQAYLRAQGVEEIEYLVLTNYHQNHIGGGVLMATDFTIKQVIMPNTTHDTKIYNNVIATLVDNAIPVSVVGDAVSDKFATSELVPTAIPVGTELALGTAGVQIKVLGPLTYTGATKLGDASVVLRLTYGTSSFLFTGNIDSDIETDLVSAYGAELASTVLKVANHGDAGSSSETFLATVGAEIAVLTSATEADAAMVTRFTDATLYQTAVSGNIVLVCNGTGVRLEVQAGDAA
jgi:competence protein ComEC